MGRDLSNEPVVLLHGLGRSSKSMWVMARGLSHRGFRVVSIDYPSRKLPIEELAEHVGYAVGRCCSGAKRVHFVTHSLGGVVLRAGRKRGQLENLGRVVMLAPPNQGSELVDILKDNALFKVATGPAGQELGTDPASIPLALGPVDFEVGVIAGNKSLNPLFSRLIPGQDDGRVSVERAKVEGMADFSVVPRIHPLMMNSSKVISQIVCFFENGRFDHQGG